MSQARIRLGTRGSVLARVQADLIARALQDRGNEVEIIVVSTSGDVRAPDTPWGEGAFVDAIEAALRAGEIDAAVHSAKDVPTDVEVDPDLVVAAYFERVDPRDALVTRKGGASSLESIPEAATVGTDSPRRQGFLLSLRPDLQVRPLSGNVDTRLRRLDAGDVDALILAVAGLERLGRTERVDLAIDPSVVPPAPGQGALAVQIRAGDEAAQAAVGPLDDPVVRLTVESERAVLAIMGGGCQAPVGAFATLERDQLTMVAGRVEPDGSQRKVGTWRGPGDASFALAAEVAEALA